MKLPALALAGVLVLGCAPQGAASPSPTLTPTASPVPAFNPRWFSVAVMASDVIDDPMPDKIARYLRTNLPAAWNIATGGRSTMFMNQYLERSDVLIVIEPAANVAHGGWAVSWARIIVLYEQPGAPLSWYATRIAPHELGHVGGCCSGPGTAAQHWICAEPTHGPLMCPDNGDATTFNGAELAQMGLGAP